MSFPQPENEEHKHNLGNCPTASQRKALKRFRRRGLWDEHEAWLSSRNPIKFTPSILAAHRGNLPPE